MQKPHAWRQAQAPTDSSLTALPVGSLSLSLSPSELVVEPSDPFIDIVLTSSLNVSAPGLPPFLRSLLAAASFFAASFFAIFAAAFASAAAANWSACASAFALFLALSMHCEGLGTTSLSIAASLSIRGSNRRSGSVSELLFLHQSIVCSIADSSDLTIASTFTSSGSSREKMGSHSVNKNAKERGGSLSLRVADAAPPPLSQGPLEARIFLSTPSPYVSLGASSKGPALS
eukprot:CAMPEP_0181237278 /NCGR_PEP_ID=MMETSP1096-20121128/38669_1 /TAXON_ID=156174 ORGANISM="Chrysochromulina ericina, Strain CCMP281" /NCGR_SAMPLE_ID=MMETSP1096 /ASSEMBLY_ACC=CAM_ASM_000453 /LENGTH=230 /DNA_ID=CAMNT_0023332605 /DNA_START=284 /DNA_END=974 /DNA_ORIENTATION=+